MDQIHGQRISPEYVLFGFLYKLPGHGYELHQRLMDEFGNIWRISQSQTYNILKRLENQGYVTSTPIEQTGLPQRNLLNLTEKGRARFDAWLALPTRCSVHAIRVEFITRVYFLSLYDPQKIEPAIRQQIQDVRDGLARLEETRVDLPEDHTFNLLALELRIKLLTSILDWLDDCLERFAPNHREIDA